MKKIVLFLTLACIYNTSLAASGEVVGDESKSIKELHETIQDLKAEKEILLDKWDLFNKENSKMSDFIKHDITEDQIKNIEGFLEEYFTKRTQGEKKLKEASQNQENTDIIKSELIRIKLDLFKSLTPYIKVDKLKDYLAYIKENVEILKEDKDIKEEIYKKEEILDKKVEAIKEKIEENNRILNEKIRQLVGQKIEEKIQGLLSNPKFVILTNEQKKYVFTKTLEKISEKKQYLKNIYDGTTIIDKKVEMYQIVEEKLKEIISRY